MNFAEKKITVVGIGGIGGIMGGMLARHYGEQVTFIARGARGESIRQKGLTVHGDFLGDFTAHPGKVQDTPEGLPVQDYVFVCVKNDALPKVIEQIRPIVGPETVAVAVMNGVTASPLLAQAFPEATVPFCCIYTVSMAEKDFSIRQIGRFTHLFLGPQHPTEKAAAKVQELTELLKEAGMDGRYTEAAETEVWVKYIWNCAYNVATARWGCAIGPIKEDPQKKEEFMTLIAEAAAVARYKGIPLPENMTEKLADKLLHTSGQSTSSLSRDFAEHREGELEVFCGDVLRLGRAAGIPMPVTEEYYAASKAQSAGWGK